MILKTGQRISLRDRLVSDVDRYLFWMTHGEWRHYDAPWEGIYQRLSPEQEAKFRDGFLEQCRAEQPTPRQRVILATRAEDFPLGWVSRYGEDRFPDVAYLGISICDDAYLDRGLGTEALQLWVDYLFESGKFRKLELHTWSLNPRMCRVAEKLGFRAEGRERELIQWRAEWQDRLRFGMLRREWGK